MGCWNGTCGISNLPIMYDERVVVFICENNGFYLRPCYSTTLCKPVLYHIKGHYDDYGSVCNIDHNKENDILLQFINKKYNTYFDTIENCVKSISRDEVPGVFLFMVKEQLFDTLIEEAGNRIPYNKTFNMKQIIIGQFKKLQKLYIKLNKTNDQKSILKIQGKLRRIKSYFSGDALSIINYCIKNNYIEFVDITLEFVLFLHVMDGLRKSFYPQNGSGSQSIEMYMHKLVSEFILEKEQKYADDYYKEASFYEDQSLWYKTDSAYPTKETIFR